MKVNGFPASRLISSYIKYNVSPFSSSYVGKFAVNQEFWASKHSHEEIKPASCRAKNDRQILRFMKGKRAFLVLMVHTAKQALSKKKRKKKFEIKEKCIMAYI